MRHNILESATVWRRLWKCLPHSSYDCAEHRVRFGLQIQGCSPTPELGQAKFKSSEFFDRVGQPGDYYLQVVFLNHERIVDSDVSRDSGIHAFWTGRPCPLDYRIQFRNKKHDRGIRADQGSKLHVQTLPNMMRYRKRFELPNSHLVTEYPHPPPLSPCAPPKIS